MIIRILLLITLMPLPALGVSMERETRCQKILRKARRQARINHAERIKEFESIANDLEIKEYNDITIVISHKLGISLRMIYSFGTYYVMDHSGPVYANILELCHSLEARGMGTPVFMRGMIRGI